MYISFFVEIEADGDARYRGQFVDIVRYGSSGKCVIASSEYTALLSPEEKERVWEIPAEIMEDICKTLENKWERDTLLVIQRNEKLEQWILECLESAEQPVEGIMCYGEYASIGKVSKDRNIKAYCEYSMRENAAQSGIQKMVAYMQQRIHDTEVADQSLREYIDSTEKYLKNLQEHATDLDNQLQQYKKYYDDNSGSIEYMQKENENYISMYKNILEELNTVRMENLDLKEKYGKHKR